MANLALLKNYSKEMATTAGKTLLREEEVWLC